MACESPVSLRRPGAKSNKDRVTVPCGRCLGCLQRRRSDWSIRIGIELKHARSANFITLTYDEQNVPRTNEGLLTLKPDDLTRFLKRLRTYQDRKAFTVNKDPKIQRIGSNWPKIRFFACGEYGENTIRPHYHILLFNVYPAVIQEIKSIWGKGFIHNGTVTPASIHYVTGYIINNPENHDKREKPFQRMSRRPGIGSQYLTAEQAKWHKENLDNTIRSNDRFTKLPRYYSDKIFNHQEKETLKEAQIDYSDINYITDFYELIDNGDDPFQVFQQRTEAKHRQSNQSKKQKSL